MEINVVEQFVLSEKLSDALNQKSNKEEPAQTWGPVILDLIQTFIEEKFLEEDNLHIYNLMHNPRFEEMLLDVLGLEENFLVDHFNIKQKIIIELQRWLEKFKSGYQMTNGRLHLPNTITLKENNNGSL